MSAANRPNERATDIRRALAFVRSVGTEMEIARLQFILFGPPTNHSVVERFLALQADDGGFPQRMEAGRPSAVDDTLTALWWMDDIGHLRSPEAERAVLFLLKHQRHDGGWDESPDAVPAWMAPWIVPGDLRTRLYLSAYVAYWLALRGQNDLPAFRAAIGFLVQHQQPGGELPSYLHANWIGASALRMAGPSYADTAELMLNYTLSKIPVDAEASAVAWALECLRQSGIGAQHPFVVAQLDALAKRQSEDGGWATEEGASFAVGTTIGVIKALVGYQRVSPDTTWRALLGTTGDVAHRAATANDKEQMKGLILEGLGERSGESLAHLGLTANEFAELCRSVGEVRVLQEAHTDVGYLWIETRDRTLHVHAMMIIPSARGRGVGTRVIRGLQEEFAPTVDAIEIGVQKTSHRAVQFYERLGFLRQPDATAPGFSIYRRSAGSMDTGHG